MIDLHTHSVVSDGSDAPAAVVDLAARAGCTAVALTDHDRLDGIPEAAARGAEVGVRVVPGCELSLRWEPGTMHLLVYFVEPGSEPLATELVRLQAARDTRNERMVQRLAEAGLPITMDEVLAESGGGGVGRPHIAAVLVANGAATGIQDAFDRWLAKGRPGYVPKDRLAVADAVALAHASGGVTSLAHPLSLGVAPADLERTLGELADAGVTGVEAVYGRYRPEERAGLADLARRLGMVVTGGSDHHGTYKPDLTVGTGTGDLDVPDGALDALAARRP